jgi:hypothetical protein
MFLSRRKSHTDASSAIDIFHASLWEFLLKPPIIVVVSTMCNGVMIPSVGRAVNLESAARWIFEHNPKSQLWSSCRQGKLEEPALLYRLASMTADDD